MSTHPANWYAYASQSAPAGCQPCRCERMEFPHRYTTECEQLEHAAIDRAIERDGAPDREHDSRGWE